MAGISAGSAFVDIKPDMRGFGRQVSAEVERDLRRVGQRASGMLSDIGRRAAVGLGVAGAAAGAAILKVGSDYEQSLNIFQSVSRASGQVMDQVRAKAKALGADMSLPATSAGDAAKAMTELVKAGLSVNDTLAASKGVLQLAAAAQVDEARAATITANALNAFGLAGSEANKVADLLAAAANASSGEITDMADAMQMSSAVFAAAKVPIADLTTAIGLMANKGIQGSDAGTSLKQMLLQLQAPSVKAKKLMNQLGLSVYDAQGKMRPLRELIGQFTERLGKLAPAQRDAALATIFGSDAVRSANIVMLGGVEAFDKMHGAVTRQGAAADVAAAKTKGLKGAWEGLKSQLETVAIELYERVSPGLESFVRRVAEAVPRAYASLSDFVGRVQRGFTEPVLAAAASAGGAFDNVPERIGGALAQIRGKFAELAQAYETGGWSGLGEAIKNMVTTSLSAVDWRGVAGRVLGGLVAAFAGYDWAASSLALTNGLINMMLALDFPRLAQAATVLIIQVAPKIVDGIIRGVFQAARERPVDFVLLLVTLGFTPGRIIVALAGVLRGIPIIGPIAGWLLGAFASIGGVLVSPIKAFLRPLGQAGMTGLREGAETVFNTGVVGFLRGVPARAAGAVGNIAGGLIAKGREALAGLLRGAAEQFDGPVIGFLRGLGGRASGAVGNLGGALVGAGRALLEGLLRGIASMFGPVQSKLGELTSKLTSWKGPPERDRRLLYGAGQMVIEGLVQGLESRYGIVRSVLARYSEELRRYFEQVIADGDYLNDWLTHLPANIRPAVRAAGQDYARHGPQGGASRANPYRPKSAQEADRVAENYPSKKYGNAWFHDQGPNRLGYPHSGFFEIVAQPWGRLTGKPAGAETFEDWSWRGPRFHEGGLVDGRRGEEVLAQLEAGEGVISAAGMAALSTDPGGTLTLEVPLIIDGREFARATRRYTARELESHRRARS